MQDTAAIVGRLQKAAANQGPRNEALDSLTGEWDLSEVKRQVSPRQEHTPEVRRQDQTPQPPRREQAVQPARVLSQRRTVYLNAEAEADLSFLHGRLSPAQRANRSEIVRKALRATRLALEGA